MIIGFTGPETGMTEVQRRTLGSVLMSHEPFEFHHGDCIGSDKQAHHIASALISSIFLHPPLDNRKRARCIATVELPPKEYLARDRDIVNVCELLIGTPRQMQEPTQKRGEGTWYTIRYATRQGKPVLIIYPDGSTEKRHHPASRAFTSIPEGARKGSRETRDESMTNMLHVSVTQKHIDKGVARSDFLCPVALALDDAMPNVVWSVDGTYIEGWKTRWEVLHTYCTYVPDRVKLWIENFDEEELADHESKPFEFEIPLIDVMVLPPQEVKESEDRDNRAP